MLKPENNSFYNVLFNNNKLINSGERLEKNNSEELLTIRTLVLISQPANQMEEYVQLEKMLTACRLEPADYKVLTQFTDWNSYRVYNNIKEVLLFGITERQINIGIHVLDNQAHQFDGRTWVKSSSLAQMANNQQIKNALWQNALKPHFVG